MGNSIHDNQQTTQESCSYNVIKQVKVSDLLDGRYFVVPSYQRGYRWTKQHIYDLCNDLLEFTFNLDKKPESFYSLQPLIVRKGQYEIEGKTHDAYEVIDGQQRLTTIFLLYRFLAKNDRYSNLKDVADDYGGKELYHIFYQTRPEDYALLEKSGFEKLHSREIRDIDMAHISNAYYHMKCWLDSRDNDPKCAAVMYSLYNRPFTKHNVVESLFTLLNKIDDQGSVQFIWYEIDTTKDAIREFLTENKGKIGLTDTEKIRALFMQRKSSNKDDVKNLKLLSIAKDWELVENTLHKNDFWSFISNDMELEDGRISVIFKYIFDNDESPEKISCDEDSLSEYFDIQLVKVKENPGNLHETNVDNMWRKVMDCFRMLQNWYYNPKTYNLVGLLVKHGYSIKQIGDIYNQASTHEDFIKKLNSEICKEIIDVIPIKKGNADLDIKEDEEYISMFYDTSEKSLFLDLLRFINVNEMNKTIDKALSEIDKGEEEKKRSDVNRGPRDVVSHIYRFPFEALDVFQWDIEHIDSAKTNSLLKPKEQIDWLKGAEGALGSKLLEDNDYAKHRKLVQDYFDCDDNKLKNLSAAITEALTAMVNYVQTVVGEDSIDVRKNWIGNLTLLDSGTNRSYKNMIFAWKRNFLQQRIRAGVFVPVCTQNVFNKIFKGNEPTDWIWSHEDKKAYHAYILTEIQQFKSLHLKSLHPSNVETNTKESATC